MGISWVSEGNKLCSETHTAKKTLKLVKANGDRYPHIFKEEVRWTLNR